MQVAAYARVSSRRQAQAQTIEQQLDRLRAVCVSPSSPCDDERLWLMSLAWWTTQTRQRNS